MNIIKYKENKLNADKAEELTRFFEGVNSESI